MLIARLSKKKCPVPAARIPIPPRSNLASLGDGILVANGGRKGDPAGNILDISIECKERPIIFRRYFPAGIPPRRGQANCRDRGVNKVFVAFVAGDEMQRVRRQPIPRALVPQAMRRRQYNCPGDHAAGTEAADSLVHASDGAPGKIDRLDA